MPIQPQPIVINFAQGMDTKTDPKQVSIGKFLSLKNSVFDQGGLLQKRNGYGLLSVLPNTSNSYITTLNNNLTAIGPSISAYNETNETWVSKGQIAPMEISTLPLIRNNLNQTQVDTAVSANGLVCTAYTELNNSTSTYKYAIADAVTGQNIVAPRAIPVTSGTVTGSPRVFILGNYFIVMFTNVISGASHLQYIAISIINPTIVTTNVNIATYVSSSALSWDAVLANNMLVIAYNTTTGGQAVKIQSLSAALVLSAAKSFPGYTANLMSLTVDSTNASVPIIYISFYTSGATAGFTAVVDQSLNTILPPVQVFNSLSVVNITSTASNGTCTIFYEVTNAYSYDSGIPSNYIGYSTITPLVGTQFHSVFSSGASSITASSAAKLVTGMTIVDITTPAHIAANTTITVSGTSLALSFATAGNSASSPGDLLGAATVTTQEVAIRGVGLASKAFTCSGTVYFLANYQSPYQSSYFLVNGSTSTAASPQIVGKLAYSNGAETYNVLGLPNVTVNGTVAQVPYLFRDAVQAVNKNTNVPAGTQVAGIYSQTGINLGTFNITTSAAIDTSEIANVLNISGGFGWMYDGYLPVEQNFLLWPDSVEVAASGTSGSIANGTYYYQCTYEWTDNQGNAYRSAPSIPVSVVLNSTDDSINVSLPMLRLTMKTANPVKLVIYRYSVAQPIYYQVTSISAPILNDPTVDSYTWNDTLADASILGNNILYTNGNVVEDVNPPAYNITTLFDTRQWVVDAEDKSLLWYSKQVIENTPVEFSELFTFYVAPNVGTTSSSGPITGLAPMDDKLVIFYKDKLVYINGIGPDNTGANNQYSQPIFITSTVGCANQASIALMPDGLMFQSDKGIWLLGRDLSTKYIGAPVAAFNSSTVTSANAIPGTNQVRFTLDSGQTLMFDYYYGQWATFVGVGAIGSCIYQNLHTFINQYGQVLQETPNIYLDGTNPVLLSFLTGPIQLQGIAGYERVWEFLLTGSYVTPHLLNVQIGYDYGPLSEQAILDVTSQNATGVYGSDQLYGQTTPYGGPASLENWRVQLSTQKCKAFQISLEEVYDPSTGVVAGAGFTMSAITCVVGLNKGWAPIKASTTSGTN